MQRPLVIMLLISGLVCGCSLSQNEGTHLSAEDHTSARKFSPRRYHRAWHRPYISSGFTGGLGSIGGIAGPGGVCD